MVGPEDEIVAAQLAWERAFAEGDPDEVLAHYDDEAVLWGTLSPTLAAGKAALRAYFELAFDMLPGHAVTFDERQVRVYSEVAVSSGSYTFLYDHDGERARLPARFTFVYRRHDEGWLILEHHSSIVPPPPDS